MYTRTLALLGEEKLNKIKSSKVLIVGLGGVGGYIAESLARAGFGCLGLCDFDIVDESNKNRQILALCCTVGKNKTAVCNERIKDINPLCKTKVFQMKLTEENLPKLFDEKWDYIADAIDDTPAKLALIEYAIKNNIKIISSCGTGNKLDPFRFKITDISKTNTDPLAKTIRIKLREKGIEKGLKVLFSDEEAVKPGEKPIPTISYMPAIAGLEISSEIIRDITNGV